MAIVEGQSLSWERTFTDEDVDAFARVTGDTGRHHREGAQGRRMVHGLLTASLPTKLGGDIDYVARTMSFDFLRPVFAGDTVRCSATLLDVTPELGRTRARIIGSCVNQDGKEVLRFEANGFVLDT